MTRRGIGFTAVILLTTLLTLTPYVAGLGYLGWLSYLIGGEFPLEFIGLTPTGQYPSELQFADLVGDRLYFTEFDENSSETNLKLTVRSVDPETGQGLDAPKSAAMTFDAGDPNSQGWNFNYEFAGDARQWWIINPGKLDELFEFNGTRLTKRTVKKPNSSSTVGNGEQPNPGIYATQDITLPYPNNGTINDAQSPHLAFMLDDRFTIVVESSGGQRELLQLVDDAWQSRGVIELLDTTRGWQNADQQSLFDPQPQLVGTLGYGVSSTVIGTTTTVQIVSSPVSQTIVTPQNSHPNPGTLRLIQHGPTCHLFWQVGDSLLYRNGLELKPKTSRPIDSSSALTSVDRTISALEPANVIGISPDWSLVTELRGQNWSPMMTGGKPGVILIENGIIRSPGETARMGVKARRFEEMQWKEYAKSDLPYGLESYNVVWRDDGSISYLCTTTALGRTQTFAIEPIGFRQTDFDHAPIPCGLYEYALVPAVWGWSFIAGLILSLVTTFMLRHEPAQFAFGHQSVQLASTFRRGLARTIDLALLLLLTSIQLSGLLLAHPPDWRTALEAVNLEDMNHPSILDVLRIVTICLACFALGNLVLISVQGRYAVTPGKWLCGLRIVRTTLKPCGFARSLLRELLLCIDSLNLISWSPGILFIAFTENRQRFGDLIADTIVIRAKSLYPIEPVIEKDADEQRREP
jgi:uncharacterized RDD family membrane protein YckC